MDFWKRILRSTKFILKSIKDLLEMPSDIKNLVKIIAEFYIDKELNTNPRYKNPKRLNKYEYQVYSQNGEDGIIAEIFNRVKTTNKVFVELGAGDGLENNTAYLLLRNWSGYWVEGNLKFTQNINKKYSAFINNKKLIIKNEFITAENTETLLKKMQVPKEFDLLSIDIDGNDYWIWKAINNYLPKVVVIEYNALFKPDIKWVMKYSFNHDWDGTSNFGASLKSLETLAGKKGYRLVGCNFTGVNTFFVRKDLVKDKFLSPYTAQNHYEPPRYHYIKRIGHDRNFGNFKRI